MLKLLSLFSGIGAFEKALTNIGINYNLVGFSEIDKYASAVYCNIHNVNSNLNLGDITKVKSFPNANLITWGFPCQNFSIANRNGQAGFSGKYSSLYYEGLRAIKDVKPEYSVIENVSSLRGDFLQVIINDMEKLGYHSHHKVLDSQSFGIPQRRKRLFVVSIRDDIDCNFSFPKERPLTIRLKDFLENNPDDKYYKVNPVIINKIKDKKLVTNKDDKIVCNTITKALSRQGSSKEFILNCSLIYSITNEIRRMTPLECWRLMGFEDKDYYNGKATLEDKYYNNNDRSDTRMYNMAANSIVVNVLEVIFNNMKRGLQI